MGIHNFILDSPDNEGTGKEEDEEEDSFMLQPANKPDCMCHLMAMVTPFQILR